MKKIFFFLLLLIPMISLGQVQHVTIQMDTTVRGQLFRYYWDGNIHITTTDSIHMQGDSLAIWTNYISLNNSTASIRLQKKRVIAPGDTLVRYEVFNIPLRNIKDSYSTFINKNEVKRAIKKAIKTESLNKKVNQE